MKIVVVLVALAAFFCLFLPSRPTVPFLHHFRKRRRHRDDEWLPSLGLYHPDELVALKFDGEDGAFKVIDLLHEDRFRTLPFALVGDHTIIVPKETQKFFEDLKPQAVRVSDGRV